MEKLFITGTDDNPEIIFDPRNNKFEISGKSLPEEVIQFYAPVYRWMTEYVKNPLDSTIIKIKIDYMNSPSQKSLFEIITIVQKILSTGKQVVIEWYYHVDDEDMEEAGKEFKELTEIPFKFISHD